MEQEFEQIFTAFRKNGGRITSQRKILIRIILENQNCSCKEIFYKAKTFDNSISLATVYRTTASLKSLGFLN